MSLRYEMPIYRPPSEADSLMIQATVGCSRPCCTFCFSSLSSRFAIRPLTEIKQDLLTAQRLYADQVRKVFLLTGNPLVMKSADLVEIGRSAHAMFPALTRIAMYAHPRDVLAKSADELREIREAGISLLYIGVESGNDTVLRRTRKHATAAQTVQGTRRAIEAGFRVSCNVIIGLGGRTFSRAHATDTARVVGEISPHYLAALTLMVYPGTELQHAAARGAFDPLGPAEALDELQLLLEHLPAPERRCVFRANHPSNYVALAGDLPDDMSTLLALSVLSARGNHLTAVPESLSRLKGLRKLDLRDNRLQKNPAYEWLSRPGLQVRLD